MSFVAIPTVPSSNLRLIFGSVAETLTEFASFQMFAHASLPGSIRRLTPGFVRISGDLDSALLSFITATRPLGTTMPKQASHLRKHLADLYFYIYEQMVKMQDAWFFDERFEQFKANVTHPTHLVFNFAFGPGNPEVELSKVSADIHDVLKDLEKVLLFHCGCSATEKYLVRLLFLCSMMLPII